MKFSTKLLLGSLLPLILFSCQKQAKVITPPDFAISTAFDGQWQGNRIDISGDSICKATTMTGSIKEGYVSLLLTYNGTILTGWVAQYGSIELKDNNPEWSYHFKGKANNQRIDGEWFVDFISCKGSWYLDQTTSTKT